MMTANPEFDAACLTLYRSYEILNHVCWQGRLPACRLYLSFRMSPCTGAYAQDAGINGKRIVFNAKLCQLLDKPQLLELFAHEMTHIFQFSQGRRGGHGKDFWDEQRRMGLIKGAVIPPSSPFGYVLFMHDLRQLRPELAMRTLAALRPPRKRFHDFFTGRLPEINH